MIVIGIDLSGPSNPKDTALAQFRVSVDGTGLIGERFESGLKDAQLLAILAEVRADSDEPMVIGLDSPLSYQDGGGGRASDTALRNRIKAIGMHPSSIMSPFYISSLTMRGMHVARNLDAGIQLVEVHPGATVGLHMTVRGGDVAPYRVPDCVVRYKQDSKLDRAMVIAARQHIVMWMEQVMGMAGIPLETPETTHQVDACGAALAAWKYATGQAVWSYPAVLPQHPYPYSC